MAGRLVTIPRIRIFEIDKETTRTVVCTSGPLELSVFHLAGFEQTIGLAVDCITAFGYQRTRITAIVRV